MAKETKIQIKCDSCGGSVEGTVKTELTIKRFTDIGVDESEADLCGICTKRMDSYLRRGCPKVEWSKIDGK